MSVSNSREPTEFDIGEVDEHPAPNFTNHYGAIHGWIEHNCVWLQQEGHGTLVISYKQGHELSARLAGLREVDL